MQSTDDRYRRLVKRVRRPPISVPGTQSNGDQGDGENGRDGADSEDPKKKGAGKEGNAGGRSDAQSGGDRQHGADRHTLDDHDVWAESIEDPTRSEAAIRSVVQEAVLEVGHDAVPEELVDALGEMRIGNQPADG